MTASSLSPRVQIDSLDSAFRRVRSAGLRLTSTRRIVLQTLFAAERPVSAEDVASGLDGRSATLDLTSVYRNLETFEGIGLVRHVHLGHAAGLYALTRGADQEYLLCEHCGTAQAVPPEALDAVRSTIRSLHGFEARFTHFPIAGLCARCID